VLFATLLTLVAVLTKIIGCGLGAKLCKYSGKDCIRIGVGMILRGEVALIVASKGEAVGLMGTNFLGPIVIVVLITTIVTPILLKIVYKDGEGENNLPEGANGFAGGYEELEHYRKN
jgi:Kef-type K+ transport system membrane component KefB